MITVLLATVGITGLVAFSQDEPIPQVVKDAFAQKYPDARKVAWEVEAADEYEAEFRMSRKKMSAAFNADGTWLETETEIGESDLPSAVTSAIAASYVGFEVAEVESVERPGEAMAYEVELENEATDQELEVLFAVDGAVIRSVTEDEDEEEEG